VKISTFGLALAQLDGILVPGLALGQAISGRIVGTVVDYFRGGSDQAVVAPSNVLTPEAIITSKTSGTGGYRIWNLQVGNVKDHCESQWLQGGQPAR